MNTKDPKYLGIPNICFSLTSSDDEREEEFSKQRIERGFDSSELWCLHDTIARFIIPRLEAFISGNCGINCCFKDEKQQTKVLKKMLRSFQLANRENAALNFTDEEFKEYERGMKLFAKYYLALWN